MANRLSIIQWLVENGDLDFTKTDDALRPLSAQTGPAGWKEERKGLVYFLAYDTKALLSLFIHITVVPVSFPHRTEHTLESKLKAGSLVLHLCYRFLIVFFVSRVSLR